MDKEQALSLLTVGMSANLVGFLLLDSGPWYLQYPLLAIGFVVVVYAGYHLIEMDEERAVDGDEQASATQE
jgi:membrane protein implicated in regulation of membrane protease activity